MELADFFDDDFEIIYDDEGRNVVLFTKNVIKNHKGPVTKENYPKEKTLVVNKKTFANALKFYVEKVGEKIAAKHKCRFIKDYALDVYRGEKVTPAAEAIDEWLKLEEKK